MAIDTQDIISMETREDIIFGPRYIEMDKDVFERHRKMPYEVFSRTYLDRELKWIVWV